MIGIIAATLRYMLKVLTWPLRRLTRRPTDVLRVTFAGAPPALPVKRPLLSLDRRAPPLSLRSAQRRLARAAADPDLSAVLIDLKRLDAGWATLETLHDLVAAVRRGGKRVVAYLPEGGGTREYYVASAASEIWMAPSTALSLTGLGVEATYFAAALERAGVRAQVNAVGRFKTAGEPFVRRGMSHENAEMLDAILAEVEDVVAASVEETRRLGPVEVREVLGRGPYGGARARELGLVDDVCYPDEVARKLAPPGRGRARVRRWAEYARGRHWMEAFPLGRPTLAVLEIKGLLVEGKSKGFRGVAGAQDIVGALRRLRRDDRTAAVVLHVDSRGGTVGASDQIRREVERLARKKPVVACMGNVAASGGYMVSAAAHQVVAQPTTLTGSIGVVGGKVSARRLYERLGLHKQARRRGAHATFESPTDGWTGGEKAALSALLEEHYRHFVAVVARGRRISEAEVEASAEGRVWTGRAAKERGLVDTLGGIGDAIALARETSDEAKRALVVTVRSAAPRLPAAWIPAPLAAALALAEVGATATAWAIEPMELRFH